jgi:hypothetical protein
MRDHNKGARRTASARRIRKAENENTHENGTDHCIAMSRYTVHKKKVFRSACKTKWM